MKGLFQVKIGKSFFQATDCKSFFQATDCTGINNQTTTNTKNNPIITKQTGISCQKQPKPSGHTSPSSPVRTAHRIWYNCTTAQNSSDNLRY